MISFFCAAHNALMREDIFIAINFHVDWLHETLATFLAIAWGYVNMLAP